MPTAPLFHPTFGSRPARIVGRDAEIELFAEGLRSPIGSRDRCILLLGQRGMGKTALLLEFEDIAKKRGFVVARVSHNEDMLDEIIELIQLKGSRFVQDKKSPISTQEIRAYYNAAFNELGLECPESVLDDMARAANGFPYLMQLVGYYAVLYGESSGAVDDAILGRAIKAARADLEDNVFTPILATLSDRDRQLLDAMARDEGVSKVSDIIKRMGATDSSFQPYRARLIDAGVVEAPRRGELVFAVPFLGEYLASQRPAS